MIPYTSKIDPVQFPHVMKLLLWIGQYYYLSVSEYPTQIGKDITDTIVTIRAEVIKTCSDASHNIHGIIKFTAIFQYF